MITVERERRRKNNHPIQLETPLSPFCHIYEIHLSLKILSYTPRQKGFNKLEYKVKTAQII